MTRTATGRQRASRRSRRQLPRTLMLEGTSSSLAEAMSQALNIRGDELREALLTRWLVTATEALQRISTSRLGEAAAASTNVEAVLRVLEAPEMVDRTDPEQILAGARARGLEARQQLLDAEGGAWTVEQVASHLGLSRQAVDKRRKAGKLLGLTMGRRGFLYPSWQFARRGVLPGWETILRELAAHDPWAQVIFMLSPSDRLSEQRPLDVLRHERVDEVKEAALVYGEHGAA